MNKKIWDIKPEIVFLVIGLIFGLAFILINLPFQIPDEPTHYTKAVHLSEGQIISAKSKVFADLYSPIPYVAPAVIIFIGKLFNLSGSILFYLGRLINVLLYLLIVYTAIRLTPVMKWGFLLLALMPMTLYEAASFSADGFTIAISFLLIATIFKLAFDDEIRKINRKDILTIIILGMLLVLSKQVYVLLLLLFFIIPSYKFENRKKKVFQFFGIVLPSILILMGWILLIKGVYVPISLNVSFTDQILFILSNPTAFVVAFLKTIQQNFQYYLITFVGTFGWLDTGLDTPLPTILVYAYPVVLILASLTDKNIINISYYQKFVSIITFLITFISIFILEYVLWTVIGNDTINGIYGRYFIPIAPLLLIMFYNKRIDFDLKGKNWVITFFILIVLSISLYMIVKRFYIH